MRSIPRPLGPAEASAALGVSAKALRLYERQGLIDPERTRAGWRAYDAKTMARAKEIVALRGLGLSLAQVAGVLDGDAQAMEACLFQHESRLLSQAQQVAIALARLRSLRANSKSTAALEIGFALPWPWNGEWFALRDVPRLGFITGPLGSGKTRFARKLAEAIPGGEFIGRDRLTDPTLKQRLADTRGCRLGSRADWRSGPKMAPPARTR